MGSEVAVKNNFSWTTINNTVINICEQLLFSKELLQAERKTTFEVQRTPFRVPHEAIQPHISSGGLTGGLRPYDS